MLDSTWKVHSILLINYPISIRIVGIQDIGGREEGDRSFVFEFAFACMVTRRFYTMPEDKVFFSGGYIV